MKFLTSIFFVVTMLFITESNAQFLRAYVGTDIPMQYKLGVNYQQGKIFHADLSAGYVGTPYNGDLYKVIAVPEKHQARKDFLMETTKDGWVFNLGVNANFGKWYGGIFAQHITLNASATYEYLLTSDLYTSELSQPDKELIQFFLNSEIQESLNFLGATINLTDEMKVKTQVVQMGGKIGRRFFFKNPRWEFRAELSFSKNVYSNTESDYDEDLFNNVKSGYQAYQDNEALRNYIENQYDVLISTEIDLDNILDFESKETEVDDFFHQYGYIPTLNLQVNYLLWVPNKIKAQQEKINQDKLVQ